MSYEAWRISYQSSEQAARAAYAENTKLKAAIIKTINDNLHLADGDVCTLIDLKRAVDFDMPNVTELRGGDSRPA